jgi:hypothetical protein
MDKSARQQLRVKIEQTNKKDKQMKTPKNARNMAKILAALMGASAVLSGCEGPVGPQGNPGPDGRSAPVMHPLWLGTFPVILEDRTGLLGNHADWFQDILTAFYNSRTSNSYNANIINILTDTAGRGNSNLRIIVDTQNSDETNYRTCKILYADISSANDAGSIYNIVVDALYEISQKPISKAKMDNYLRLAMAPQKKAYAPLAEFGKRKNIQIQNRVAAAWSSRRYC